MDHMFHYTLGQLINEFFIKQRKTNATEGKTIGILPLHATMPVISKDKFGHASY